MTAMFMVLGLLFGLTVWAALLWGSIKLVDRHNPKNKFLVALIFAGIQIVVSLTAMAMGLLAIAIFVMWLVGLTRLLMNYYNLTLGPALLVVVMLLAAPFGIQYVLERLVEIGPIFAGIAVIGTPFAIMGVWLYGHLRGPRAPRMEDAPVPVARVVKRPEPSRTSGAVAAIQPVRTTAPEATPARDPAAPGEPTLLR
jgi:hypothetical protein